METKRLHWTEQLGHVLGGIGHNLIYALMAGYVSIFFTDVFGLDAGFVATLFLAARVWDAVNDPIMGVICDRTKSRFGHFRCWLLYASPVVAIALALCFTKLNVPYGWACAFASVVYILLGMSFTAVDIPYWGLPAAMTENPDERTKLYTVAGLVATLASGVGAILIPAVVTGFGAGDAARGYFAAALLLAVLGLALYVACFALTRERVRGVQGGDVSLRTSLRAIGRNKPLLILMAASLLGNLAFQIKIALNAYYATYALGSFDYAMWLSATLLPGMLLGALLVPGMRKKWGAKKALLFFNGFGAVVAVASYFAGYQSVYVCMAFLFLFAIVLGAFTVLINAMVADTIDYAELMQGRRSEGTITSMRTFITKLATALAGSVPLYVMKAAGFTANAVNPPAVNNTIHLLISLIPGVAFALSLLPASFYPLDSARMQQIESDLATARAAGEVQ